MLTAGTGRAVNMFASAQRASLNSACTVCGVAFLLLTGLHQQVMKHDSPSDVRSNYTSLARAHHQQMSQCTWVAQFQVNVQTMQSEDRGEYKTTGGVQMATCVIDQAKGDWMFIRLGDFDTNGGSSWTSVKSSYLDELFSTWQIDGYLYVKDHVLGGANEFGDLIGDPPLHQHHAHLNHDKMLFNADLQTHGDNECTPEEGGVYCNINKFPDSFAFKLRKDLFITSEFLDVRPMNSVLLRSFVLVGVFLLHDAPRATIKQANPILHGPQRYGSAYHVNTSIFSIGWHEFSLPPMRYVFDAYFHAHWATVDSLWWVDADAMSLGLCDSPYDAARAALLPLVELMSFKHRVVSHMQPTASFLCKTHSMPEPVRRIHCEDLLQGRLTFERFLNTTFIAMFHPLVRKTEYWAHDRDNIYNTEGVPNVYPMHASVRVLYA